MRKGNYGLLFISLLVGIAISYLVITNFYSKRDTSYMFRNIADSAVESVELIEIPDSIDNSTTENDLILNENLDFFKKQPIQVNSANTFLEGFPDNNLSICDIGFVILSAPQYYQSRIVDLQKSWLKHLCKYKTGNLDDNQDYSANYVLVASEEHPNLPTMTPECDESYDNLCCKTLASYEWMLKVWPDKKWYMKLDDDTFVILQNLLDELKVFNHLENHLIGGQIYLTLEDANTTSTLSSRSNNLPWAQHEEVIKGIRGGAGYLMSSSLAKLFVKNGKRYMDICSNGGTKFAMFEDASTALLVTELAGQKAIKHIPGFHFHNPQTSYRLGYNRRSFKPVTFHLMHHTEEMPFLDYLLNAPVLPSTYSCNHPSISFCFSPHDLRISSKYWDPVYFGPLDVPNSKILGSNAIIRQFSVDKDDNLNLIQNNKVTFLEEGTNEIMGTNLIDETVEINNITEAFVDETQIDSNKNIDLLPDKITQIKPKSISTIELLYPEYNRNKKNEISASSIFNITKSIQIQNNDIENISRFYSSLEVETIDTNHPCADIIDKYSNRIKEYYEKVFNGINEIVFVGFPDHPNRGDSAIFVGGLLLIESLKLRIIKAIHLLREYDKVEILSKFTVPESQRAIVFHGGGNFGDLYTHHHKLRHVVMSDFHDYTIVMFPQTVFFRNVTNQMATHDIFVQHQGKVFLAARDTNSMDTLQKMFNNENNNIEITMLPDLAFLIGDQRKRRGIPLLDLLIHARMDNEAPLLSIKKEKFRMSKINMNAIKNMIKDIKNLMMNYKSNINYQERKVRYNINEKWFDFITVLVDDWLYSDAQFKDVESADFIEKSISRTLDGMAFLSRAQMVITNRLHGHILMILLGIPHIIMGDSFGKLAHFRDTWTSNCPLSIWHDDFSDALYKAILEL
ncbi:hypothetical protein ACR3K2_04320 [Cryptosporidium serpentis]